MEVFFLSFFDFSPVSVHFSSSPKAFIGDPVFPEKILDSRSEALRE